MILSSGNFEATIKSLLGLGKRRFEIVADYIEHGDPIYPRKYGGLNPTQIIADKPRLLNKILAYCKERDIRAIHAHGPIYEGVGRQSVEYFDEVNRRLTTTGVMLAPEMTYIPLGQVGDSADHVAPAFKQDDARRYAEMLAARLQVELPETNAD